MMEHHQEPTAAFSVLQPATPESISDSDENGRNQGTPSAVGISSLGAKTPSLPQTAWRDDDTLICYRKGSTGTSRIKSAR